NSVAGGHDEEVPGRRGANPAAGRSRAGTRCTAQASSRAGGPAGKARARKTSLASEAKGKGIIRSGKLLPVSAMGLKSGQTQDEIAAQTEKGYRFIEGGKSEANSQGRF